MGGVQTLIFLSQSGNDEVKVSDVVVFEKLIIETHKKIDALAIYTSNKVWCWTCKLRSWNSWWKLL